MNKYVWVVTFTSSPDGKNINVLGVYERLQDAREDNVPDSAEVIEARDQLMSFKEDHKFWKIVNKPVIENQYNK